MPPFIFIPSRSAYIWNYAAAHLRKLDNDGGYLHIAEWMLNFISDFGIANDFLATSHLSSAARLRCCPWRRSSFSRS